MFNVCPLRLGGDDFSNPSRLLIFGLLRSINLKSTKESEGKVTVKKEIKRLHKKFRQEEPKIPFTLSIKLARLLVKGKDTIPELQKAFPDLQTEESRSCECCGLPFLTFIFQDGRSFRLDVWRRSFL